MAPEIAPYAPLDVFAPPVVMSELRADGARILRAQAILGPHDRSVVHAFRRRAELHGDRVLAAQRDSTAHWRTLTWGEARRDADGLAQAFLDRHLSPKRPLMVLSGNSLEHLVMMLGAFTAGVPVLPISAAYSLQSLDHNRIRGIAELCRPGAVFADDPGRYGEALEAVVEVAGARVITATGSAAGGEPLSTLLHTPPEAAVQRAVDDLTPNSVAKILFTSGSTGTPKGVLTTHGMLCSNQQALGQVWPFLNYEPPVLVDWLPWSHTFGGSHNLGQVLAYGGTLYIDSGRPTADQFERTVEALRVIAPTVYYNVPSGYALLTPRLEADDELARMFFSRLRFMFYAAAALPEGLWHRLRAVSNRIANRSIPLTASWGTTETAPAATTAHFPSAVCGCIGVPIPGVTIKLVPAGPKYELRVAGPNVTPGYYRDETATAAAFDEEGFYRPGDAAQLVDPGDPDQGLMFDGRLSEDFKLTTGTWVHVGAVRTALLSAAGGVLSDAVIAGADRTFAAAMAWISDGEAQRACGADAAVPFDDPRLRGLLSDALYRLNKNTGSASSVRRLILLEEPPQIDAGEITDKGYINQRAVLERRSSIVDRLFAEPLPEEIITTA